MGAFLRAKMSKPSSMRIDTSLPINEHKDDKHEVKQVLRKIGTIQTK